MSKAFNQSCLIDLSIHIKCVKSIWNILGETEKTKQNSDHFRTHPKKELFPKRKECLNTQYPYTELHFSFSNYPGQLANSARVRVRVADSLMTQNIRGI